MDKIELDGRAVTYHDTKMGDPVVLLHPGFVADAMLPLFQEPALERFRLIAPHRRGYGRSDPGPPPVSMADLASDVVRLLDALGIERADLVGHSLGGCVALQVAHASPERVGRVALLEPPLGFCLSEASLGMLMSVAGEAMRRFAAGEHAEAVGVWLDGAFGPGWQSQLEQTLPGGVAQATRDAPAALAIEVPALQTWTFGPPYLAEIRAPLLSVIHEDPWAGFTDVHQALVAVGAESATVPVRSHLLQLINARAVAETIAAFLGASVASAASLSPTR